MLTPAQSKVFAYVARYCQRKGYAPTFEEIGRHAGIGISTVFKHVHALIDAGYLAQTRMYRGLVVTERPGAKWTPCETAQHRLILYQGTECPACAMRRENAA